MLLLEERGSLFVGDALCTWNPLTGRRGPQVMPKHFNVDYEECFRSLAAFEGLPGEVLFPGHCEPWQGTPAQGAEAAIAARG